MYSRYSVTYIGAKVAMGWEKVDPCIITTLDGYPTVVDLSVMCGEAV